MSRFIALVAFTLFSCSGPPGHPSAPSTVAAVPGPDPISAPSSKFGSPASDGEQPKEEQGTPVAVPQGPRMVNFTDVKFSIVLPNADWKVDIVPQGVALSNPKANAALFLTVQEDGKPLKELAEQQVKDVKKVGKFTVSEITEAKDPERVWFTATMKIDDTRTAVTYVLFRRNPADPKQTIGAVGMWFDGNGDSEKQVRGIIDSIAPIK